MCAGGGGTGGGNGGCIGALAKGARFSSHGGVAVVRVAGGRCHGDVGGCVVTGVFGGDTVAGTCCSSLCCMFLMKAFVPVLHTTFLLFNVCVASSIDA